MRTLLFIAIFAGFTTALLAREIQFDVTNETAQKITTLTALEKGANRRIPLFVGKGIKPGITATVVWATFAEEGDCLWTVQAKFENGTLSKPVAVDFCKQKEFSIKE